MGDGIIRVVIIDDNRLAVQSILKVTDWKGLGCKVVGTAYDGISGLDLVNREHPDIVVTDIRMPGYDGLNMISQLREMGEETSFIIISGYNEFEYAKRALKLGVSDFLVKPITKEKIEEAITNVIAKLIPGRVSETKEQYEAIIDQVRTNMPSYSSLVRSSIEYIEKNIHKDITLSSVAEHEGVTPNYISRIFKKEIGIGFQNFVTLLKMDRARKLLANPQNKAYEIASMLGYSNYAYFSQVFKKEFGYSPTDERFNKGRKGE